MTSKANIYVAVKSFTDRSVCVCGAVARGRASSLWFYGQEWTSGAVIFWSKSASLLLILMSGLSFGPFIFCIFFLWLHLPICFGTQPHISNPASVSAAHIPKNNPSQLAFHRYCQVLMWHRWIYVFEACDSVWALSFMQQNYLHFDARWSRTEKSVSVHMDAPPLMCAHTADRRQHRDKSAGTASQTAQPPFTAVPQPKQMKYTVCCNSLPLIQSRERRGREVIRSLGFSALLKHVRFSITWISIVIKTQ